MFQNEVAENIGELALAPVFMQIELWLLISKEIRDLSLCVSHDLALCCTDSLGL